MMNRRRKTAINLKRNGTEQNGVPRRRKLHVVSPATGSKIRKTLRITHAQMKNVSRALEAAGVRL